MIARRDGVGALLLIACGAGGGGADEDAPEAAAICEFRGPYAVSLALTAGSSALFYEDGFGISPLALGSTDPVLGCAPSTAGAPVIQTTDQASCSLVACLGERCLELECDLGAPVASCSGAESYMRTFRCGCSEPTLWRLDERTHMIDQGAICPASCATSMQCDYSWRLTSAVAGG